VPARSPLPRRTAALKTVARHPLDTPVLYRRCLYTAAHSLGLGMDDEQTCFGCRIHEEKEQPDVRQFWYPDDATLASVGVRGIYLRNYLRWDPKARHAHIVEAYGHKGARRAGQKRRRLPFLRRERITVLVRSYLEAVRTAGPKRIGRSGGRT
jgi:hypothetical protein